MTDSLAGSRELQLLWTDLIVKEPLKAYLLIVTQKLVFVWVNQVPHPKAPNLIYSFLKEGLTPLQRQSLLCTVCSTQ